MALPVRQSPDAHFPASEAVGIVRWNLDDLEWQYWNGSAWVSALHGGGGAPTNAEYVVLALDGTLSDERVLIGTAGEIVVTDGGAGGNVALGIANRSARSVMGRSAATAGVVGDIIAAADGQVLRRSSGTVGFGALGFTDIPSIMVRTVTSIMTPYSVASDDSVLRADPSAGIVTFNLPAVSAQSGRRLDFKNVTSSGGFRLTPNGVDTIDGAATLIVTRQYAAYTLVAPDSGSDWMIL